MSRALVFLFLAACGAPLVTQPDGAVESIDAGSVDGGVLVVDAGTDDAGTVTSSDGGLPDPPDAGLIDAGSSLSDGGATMTTLVTVSSQRELRGVWVASVVNLDWPTATGQSVAAGRASLTALVDSMADAGLNTLFFQVRPESDALYASTIEPWSRYLTGTQGLNPGWDPLDELVTLAHARGLEVHAWINPYRALQNSNSAAAANHVSQILSAATITYDGKKVMNPGELAVRQHVEAVVQDILTRYDVDGLHFDDYFYPYPDAANTPFPDSATYAAYQSGGGTLTLKDWRRDNVNTLVREVMTLVTNDHPQVRFGISPFGIWRSNMPVPGLDAYDTIYCDAPTWMLNGWVDYLAPQLYWLESSPQKYSTLASWWAGRNMGGRHLFPGHAQYHLTDAQSWPLAEIQNQVTYTRTLRAQGALGDVHFRARNIFNDDKGVHGLFKNTLYAKPALTPVLPRAGASVAPAVPFVSLVGNTLSVTSPQPMAVRFFALYQELSPGQFELTRVLGGAQVSFPVTPGAWAVSAVARGGAESQGVRVVVP